MEWVPPKLRRDGSHYHLPAKDRVRIYRHLREAIEDAWLGRGPTPTVALCKESTGVRAEADVGHSHCHCE